MKKALSVFLMIAVAFGAFADEPVADVNVAEFSGNAAVQWGVDLDSGTTGFQNSTEVNLKLNLLKGGSKSTTGDGVWGELVLKADGDPIQWQQKAFSDDAFEANKGMQDGGNLKYKVFVDVAKIHIGPAYIGIKSGDTQTGALKMDAAIRSADDSQAKWLSDVGPNGYTQGIVAGYDSDMFKLELDVRSRPYTSTRQDIVARVVNIIDNDGNPATVGEGDIIVFSDGRKTTVEADGTFDGMNTVKVLNEGVLYSEVDGDTYQYTDNYAAAIEGEFKGVENLSIKAGASYNFSKNSYNYVLGMDKGGGTAKGPNGQTVPTPDGAEAVDHILGYSASAGYKLGLNDTFFLRPQIGFAGVMATREVGDDKETMTGAEMALGLLLGWGDIGQDKNAGVYYLNDNMAKKVSPGVGVVAHIPFASKQKSDGSTSTYYGPIAARIMPSFFSGELIPGLTAAAYGDIVVPKTGEDSTDTAYEIDKAETAMAFTFGAKYAIEAGEVTITPQAGVRFANAAYVDYTDAGYISEKDDAVFGDMGQQKKKVDADEKGISSDGNYMNVKLGVEVAGLIDNTTLGVEWASRNVLNDADQANFHDPKLGTLNFKAKIAL